MSQSFATFSSQALAKADLKKKPESTVALEVLGCIKRCINQSAYTKCLVYKVIFFKNDFKRSSKKFSKILFLKILGFS